jgi:Na+-translocating ferredoxin:NAD+ oxidoreductase subunit B
MGGCVGVLAPKVLPVEGSDVVDDSEKLEGPDAPEGHSELGEVMVSGLTTRAGRIGTRERNPKWKNPAFRIDMSTCINCDTCLRHCPPHFGAIFNHGLDVIIVSELCSGCGKCLPPVCPVDCIVLDPHPDPTPSEWWDYPLSSEDPYR